jgi:hypothetical protein
MQKYMSDAYSLFGSDTKDANAKIAAELASVNKWISKQDTTPLKEQQDAAKLAYDAAVLNQDSSTKINEAFNTYIAAQTSYVNAQYKTGAIDAATKANDLASIHNEVLQFDKTFKAAFTTPTGPKLVNPTNSGYGNLEAAFGQTEARLSGGLESRDRTVAYLETMVDGLREQLADAKTALAQRDALLKAANKQVSSLQSIDEKLLKGEGTQSTGPSRQQAKQNRLLAK